MDLFPLRLFQKQIECQCHYVMLGFGDMQRALLAQEPTGHEFWCYAQGFMVSAANISKVLWGGGGKLSAKREPLRQSLNVDDSSPFKDTAMRNNFEHFDDRLDTWWVESPNKSYIDYAITPYEPEAVVGGEGVSAIDRFRFYNQSTHTVTFWGEAFDTIAIYKEALRILPIAEQEAAKPHWR